MGISPILILVLIVVLYLISSIKILVEYERGVIFRLGKLLPEPKGPGVILVFAPIDRIVRVSLRTVVFDVPPQDVITRDNVSVKVNAVVYFRVIDPRRAIVEVENSSTQPRSWPRPRCGACWGRSSSTISCPAGAPQPAAPADPRPTHDPWGIKVSAVEVKQVDLPPDMQRAMAKQAEAEREKRAKIIHAAGELGPRKSWHRQDRDCRPACGHHASVPADAD